MCIYIYRLGLTNHMFDTLPSIFVQGVLLKHI